jgi:hypothetical protein
VLGKCAGAGRVMRKWIVVFRARNSLGRSCSVFTVHRSTPQAAELLALLVRAETPAETARAAARAGNMKNRFTITF